MITQGANRPLAIGLAESIEGYVEIHVSLHNAIRELKHWRESDIEVLDNKALICPITQAESVEFAAGRAYVCVKWLDNDGIVHQTIDMPISIRKFADKHVMGDDSLITEFGIQYDGELEDAQGVLNPDSVRTAIVIRADGVEYDDTEIRDELGTLKEDLDNTKSSLSESITDIYSAIKDGYKYDRYTWELGTIDLTNGSDKGTTKSIRTKNMVFVPNGKKVEIRPINYSDGSIVVYKADKSFLTYKNYSKATANPSYTATEDCYIRLILKSQTDTSVGNDVYSQYLIDMYCNPKQMQDDIEVLKAEVTQNKGFENEKTIVCFGDSITQGIGVLTPHQVPTEDYPSVMATILKATVYNGGIGGTTITSQRNGSLCEIADAIVSGDWSAIDTAISDLIASHTDGTFDGLTTQFNRIKALDFNNVDVICLAYGTNDWHANRNLDYSDNPINKGGICSALRYSIQKILSAYPHLRIYFFTPAYRDKLGTNNDETSDTFVNTKGNLLSEVGDAIENTCKELHIPCKNMYYSSNLNRYTRDKYMFDSTHRNADGYALLASQYAKFILAN